MIRDRFDNQQRGFVERSAELFLDEHQFAVFDFEIFDVIGQLELIPLFGEFFLQRFVDQRCGHGEIADFDLGGIECRVTIFSSEVSGESEVDVFACDLGKKLSPNDVSVHGDLVILDIGNCARELSGGSAGRSIRGRSRRRQYSNLREPSRQFAGIYADFAFTVTRRPGLREPVDLFLEGCALAAAAAGGSAGATGAGRFNTRTNARIELARVAKLMIRRNLTMRPPPFYGTRGECMV